MPIRDDVTVVGGGIAGCAAALAAAGEGARVRLISHKKSTLRHASGLVDVLGYAGGDGPVADPYAAIPDLPEDHPYRILGVETVREAVALFDDAVEGYLGGHTDQNALVPTHGGTVKPTARYPEGSAAGLASAPGDMLLVNFRGMTDFSAEVAAEHLRRAGAPFEVAGVELEFPKTFRADAKITRYAKALDVDEDVDGRGTREALAERVKPHLDGAERVGFPALLGDDHAAAVRTALERALGADVFEVPMGPPSLPGLRLEDALYDALEEAGVRLTTGNPVVGYEADGDRLEAVYVDQRNRQVPFHAEGFVLATGGLVGKGIDSSREDGVEEPVFDCHIPAPEDRYDWWSDEAFGDHPFARFGVTPDPEMRPLTAAGDPEFANLHAAGDVVGGADIAAEKSGSGVSLATGLVAGRNAVGT